MKQYLNMLTEAWQHLAEKTRLCLGGALALLLLLAILLSAVNTAATEKEKKRRVREADLIAMLTLKQHYRLAQGTAQTLTNRLAAVRPDDSLARVIEEIGIKGKATQVKALKSEDLNGFVAETAEAILEGLTANEAINLLYRLENNAKPVILKKAAIKTRFDDPARLDLNLTLALLKAPAQARQ